MTSRSPSVTRAESHQSPSPHEHQRTLSEMSTEDTEELVEVDDGVTYSERGLSPKRKRSSARSVVESSSFYESSGGGSSEDSSGALVRRNARAKEGKTSQLKAVGVFGLAALVCVLLVVTVSHEPKFKDRTTVLAGVDSTGGKTTSDGQWLDGYYCASPFGTVQGAAHGVAVRSNCNDSYTSMRFVTLPLYEAGVSVEFGPYVTFSNVSTTTASGDSEVSADQQSESFKGFQFTLFNMSTGGDKTPTTSPGSSTTTTQIEQPGVYTGMEWQCVEYARRFMALKMGVIFGDVEGATNIWDLTTAKSVLRQVLIADPTNNNADVKTGTQTIKLSAKTPDGASRLAVNFSVPQGNNMTLVENFTFAGYANNHTSLVAPSVGDLIIYPKQRDMPYGHVSVVVGVKLPTSGGTTTTAAEAAGYVRVAEENWTARKWSNSDYAREIPLTVVNNVFALEDPYQYVITGWKRAECPCE